MDKQPARRRLMYVGVALTVALAVFLCLSARMGRQGNRSAPSPRRTQGTAAPTTSLTTTEGAAPTLASSESGVIVDSASCRRTSEFDPGTLRVFLRNHGKEPLAVEQVLLDGLPIAAWGVDLSSDTVKFDGVMASPQARQPAAGSASAALRVANERICWAKLTPSPVPPGGIAEFSAKLANAVARPSKVEFIIGSGQKCSAVVHPTSPTIAITAITFSPTRSATYVYVENLSDRVLPLASLEIDGAPVTRGAWFGSRTLQPGAKDVIRVNAPCAAGAYMVVRLASSEDSVAEERVRVLSGFSISTENGTAPLGLELDEVPYLVRPDYVVEDVPPPVSPEAASPSQQADCIFDCPMHAYGRDYARSAREILRRYDLVCRLDPPRAAAVQLCRTQPETGYALFAETADVLCANPNVPFHDTHLGAEESSARSVEELSHSAYLAARPRPFVSVVDVLSIDGKTEPTVSDFRARTYAILAAGAKGILYRNVRTAGPYGMPVHAETVRLNRMLRSIRHMLGIADPVNWATLEARDSVAVHTLLAGDMALFLFLIDHSVGARTPVVAQGAGNAPDKSEDTLHIRVDAPAWAKLTHAERLDDGDQPEPEIAAVGPCAYELRVPRPRNGASLFLIRIQKGNP